jgi:predicted HTH domain antitoxin
MVSQNEVDFMNMKIEALEKESVSLNKRYEGRGKSLNKLWEKDKELRKEIVTLQKYCGKLTFDLSKLQLENRIIVPSATKQIDCPDKQFLVRDIVRQLINKAGFDLEFNVLQLKQFIKDKK